ncbi:MAG: hypothetical protein HYR48_01565 [Gemmatimonadetes bacterium]|nr:hypothetical protein [Gemmatimonadota bacterium]
MLAQDSIEQLRPGVRVRVYTSQPGFERIVGRVVSVNVAKLVVRRGGMEVSIALLQPEVRQVEVEASRRGVGPLLAATVGLGALMGGAIAWGASKPAGCGACRGNTGMALAAAAAGGGLGAALILEFGPRQWRIVLRN